MAFRIRYQCNVEFIPPGVGPMGANGNIPTPGLAPTGIGFTLAFFQNPAIQPATATFTSGDVTTLTNAMAADLATQMNANLARVAAFATGGS